jgi:uncharacterized protein
VLGAVPAVAARAAEFAAIFFSVSFIAHLLVQSLPPQRLQRALGVRPYRSTLAALVLGALTPFCTCSTVPVVAGMVAAGVPTVATTAFLVVSPLVNPATVALLATLMTPQFAALFVVLAMVLALVVALALSLLRIEPAVSLDVRPCTLCAVPRAWGQRLSLAARRSLRDLGRLLPVLLMVALVGAMLSGRVEVRFVAAALETAGPFAVPVAVLVGVPVYASTALLLPLGAALLAGGANLGVVVAFLVGATGLSLPEGLLLQRLMGLRYLAALAAAFTLAAVALGYVVQALSSGPLTALGVG